MKIVVFADTHKEFHRLNALVKENLDSADLFIHLGDGELEMIDIANLYPTKSFVFVKGEDDFREADEVTVINVGGYNILCTHGHNFGVTDGLDNLIESAKESRCQIALFGHTHLHRTDLIDGVYLMNPGSIESPRGKNKPSYGVIEISPEGQLTMNIIETDFGSRHK